MFGNGKLIVGILVPLIMGVVVYCGGAEMDGKVQNDWPMDRHDPHMSGYTPLKGKMIEAPEVQWRHYLGLWSNYLEVSAAQGNEIIDLPGESFGEGYYGQNTLEWGLRRTLVDIDGKGTMVDPPNQCSVKLAKLLPGVSGLQRVEFDNAFSVSADACRGRMYAYDEGMDKPRLIWETEIVKDMYSPVVAITDADLDGQDEIVLLTHYHLAIYDAFTGKVKSSVRWNVGRNYGQLDVMDVNSDGRPDFVVQADDPPHLELILNEPEGIRLAWSHKYLKDEGDVAVPREFYLQNLPNAVRDLDGDGRMEMAVNIHDFKSDRRWHTVIFDVLTGEVKSDIVGRYLWAIADLAKPTLCLSDAPDKTIERDLELFAMAYQDGEPVTIWESQGKGRFCMMPYHFPQNVNSASSRGPVNRSTIVSGDVDEDGNNEFFVSIGQKLLAIGEDGEKYKTKFTISSPSEQSPKAIAARGSTVLVEVLAESGEIKIDGAAAKLKSHYRKGNFLTTPIVADLNGDGVNEIAVENATGYIEVLTPPCGQEKKPNVRWKFRGFAQPVWVTWKTWHAPVSAVDLDGDGKKEIICCDSGDESHTTIYALKADGSVFWKSELDWLAPRLTESFKVGQFRPAGWDVLVTVQESTQPEMLCLDGRTGEVRWHKKMWKDDSGKSWPYPNRFMCYDADGDGFHEIYGSYAYMYYVLDGNTGEAIRKPINVWHEVFDHWQAYYTPIPADFNGDGKAEFLLASESYAIGGVAVVSQTCDIIWENPLPNSAGARGLQGIGDADGDGIPDIMFYHIDNRMVCYDGKTGTVKWQIDGIKSHASMSGGHFASGDIDSDGRDEFIYSLGPNEIIALDHDVPNHVLWRAKVAAQPDTPILADVDGDGLAEIVVCTADGYLNILK